MKSSGMSDRLMLSSPDDEQSSESSSETSLGTLASMKSKSPSGSKIRVSVAMFCSGLNRDLSSLWWAGLEGIKVVPSAV